MRAFERSLAELGADYVDLYLIHWPVPSGDRYLDTWRAFERIQSEGRARTIGVSNFRIEDLERLGRETKAVPTVNQVELHPRFQQVELRAWHAEHRVATEAWSPLGQGELLDVEEIVEIAAAHEKTPAQTIVRWSVTPERIVENFAVFDFELSEDEMAVFEALDTGRRFGPDPAAFVSP
jgi:2,5-diketo-D-gluconate reductase A